MNKAKRARSATKAAKKVMRGVTRPDESHQGTRGHGPQELTISPSPFLKPSRSEKSTFRSAWDLSKKEGYTENVARLLWKSHKSGDRRATYCLASWYVHGTGFEVDAKKAFRLLRQARGAGIPEALFDLGVSYETGFGVAKSAEKALEFYIEAASKGDVDALQEVVRCVFWGIGIQRNKKLAYLIRDFSDRDSKSAR